MKTLWFKAGAPTSHAAQIGLGGKKTDGRKKEKANKESRSFLVKQIS